MNKISNTDSTTKTIQNPRTIAIKTLVDVQQGKSLAQVLHHNLEQLEPKNRGFYHELVLGTLRHWFALIRISENLAHKPITDMATIAAIHAGMYQLFYMRTPDHAAIGETVTALKQAGSEETSGLVNALLRKCQKDFNKISKKIHKNHSLPNWLAKQIKTDWKPFYNDISSQLRTSAAIFLRVNLQKTTVDEYCSLLTEEGINHTVQCSVIRLDDSIGIDALPNFEEGYVSVQDANAQKAVTLFEDLTDCNVLDACAAPGGKTAQLLESYTVKNMVAVDVDSHRTLKIADGLSRLGLLADEVHLITQDVAELSISDVAKLPVTEKIEAFDAILLDAPCTATGVIRRHPDICLLRQEEDVEKTVALQQKILENTWKMLRKGGEMVYVTCSLLKAENSEQIATFLKNNPNAEEIIIESDWGIGLEHGKQCLPINESNEESSFIGDGFYFCKLRKKTD